MAGRKKKPEDQKMRYVTVGLGPTEQRIVDRYVEQMGVSQSYAIRVLIRSGAQGPARSPFTPEEES
jgi:hypothetical protein